MSRCSFVLILCLMTLAAQLAWSAVQPPKGQLRGYDMIRGKKVRMSLSKRPTVYTFLSAKCPCSHSHTNHIAELSKKFKGFRFVSFNSNKDEGDKVARDYFRSSKVKFPILKDTSAKWADRFGAVKTPHAYVVDTDGTILYSGGVSNSADFSRAKDFYLKDALTQFARGDKTPIRAKRTLGCYIAR